MVDKHGTCKDFSIIPVWLTVAVQREDDRPKTHSTVVEHCSKEHNNRSCVVYVGRQNYQYSI